MNKERIEKAKQKLAEAQAELDALEARPWEPTYGKMYCYVCDDGSLDLDTFMNRRLDIARIGAGNCFRTEEEAKTSRIYKAFHDDYHYWIPGIDSQEDKPDEMPEWCEFYGHTMCEWIDVDHHINNSHHKSFSSMMNEHNVILRWPKNK